MAAADTLSLNLCDLPEAQYSRHKARLYGVRSKKAKGFTRSKVVRLPVLSEIGTDDMDQFKGNPEEEPHSWWDCAACTFRNHELLLRCEVCNSEKVAPSCAKHIAQIPSIQAISGEASDWPALPEAWADCEVSSVASSWLDVGAAANEHPDTDGESARADCEVSSVASSWLDVGGANESASDVVIVDENSAKARVKPMLWSAIVKKNIETAPEPALVAPFAPSLRQKTPVASTEGTEVEDTDAVLDELESRRMFGNAKQRHCGARKK